MMSLLEVRQQWGHRPSLALSNLGKMGYLPKGQNRRKVRGGEGHGRTAEAVAKASRQTLYWPQANAEGWGGG